MSIKVMQWVLDHSPSTGNDRLVLLGVANHADDDGCNAWPSIETLARYANASERTAQRSVDRLATAGLLEVERNAGGWAGMRADRRPNRYRVVMDELDQEPAEDPADPPEAPTAEPEPGPSRGDSLTPRGDAYADTYGVTAEAPRGDTGVTRTVQNRPNPHTPSVGFPAAPSQPAMLPAPVERPTPAKRGKRPLPDDWRPSSSHAAVAAERGRDLAGEAAAFRDYCAAHDRRYADPDAAFRNWLRNDRYRSNGNGNGNGRRSYKQAEADESRDAIMRLVRGATHTG